LATTRTTVVAVALALAFGLGLGLAVGNRGSGEGSGRTEPGAAHAEGATANSNGRMIAVTGAVGSGVSVLWLVDTEDQRLSVYRSENGKNLVWVAGRNIAYDFKVEGYHDDSKESAEKLRRLWEQHALKQPLERPKKDEGGAVTGPESGDGKEDR